MAYLYRKKRSPFWYVVYFDEDEHERHRSTGFLADDPEQTSKAMALRAKKEAAEHYRSPDIDGGKWEGWVDK